MQITEENMAEILCLAGLISEVAIGIAEDDLLDDDETYVDSEIAEYDQYHDEIVVRVCIPDPGCGCCSFLTQNQRVSRTDILQRLREKAVQDGNEDLVG